MFSEINKSCILMMRIIHVSSNSNIHFRYRFVLVCFRKSKRCRYELDARLYVKIIKK